VKSLLTEEKATSAVVPNPNKTRWVRHLAWLWLLLAAWLLLIIAHQFPASYSINPGEKTTADYLADFHEVETDKQGDFWRWSKPTSHLRLFPLDASMRVTVTVETSKPPPEAVRPLQLGLVNDPNPQEYKVPFGRSSFYYDTNRVRSFFPQFFSTSREGYLDKVWFSPTLEFKTDVFAPQGDRRELGMIVRLVEVSSAPVFGGFGIPTFLEIILTALIALTPYFLLRSLFKPRGQLIIVAAIPVLIWLSFVAWGRVPLAQNIELITFGTIITALTLIAARLLAVTAIYDLRFALYASKIPLPSSLSSSSRSNKVATEAKIKSPILPTLIKFTLLIPPAIVLIGMLIPQSNDPYFSKGWGSNYWANLPVWLIVILVLVALVSAFFPHIILTVLNRLPRPSLRIGLTVAVVLTIIIFTLLRTRNSYGDSEELMGRLTSYFSARQQLGDVPIMVWREREPLDFALHFLLWTLMLNFDWWKPELTYIVPSILAGAVFVLVLILLVRELTPNRAGRWLIAGTVLSSGTILVFCGYIESYTFVTLAATVYILLAVYAIKGKYSPLWAALALIFAIMLHPLAIFLGVSFVFVLVWRAGLGDTAFKWRMLIREALASGVCMAAGVASLLLLFAFYGYNWRRWSISQKQLGGSDEGMFRPLFRVNEGTREIYPIFSFDFLIFEFNLLLRVIPLALFLILILAAWHVQKLGNLKLGIWLFVAGVLLFFLGATLIGKQPVTFLALGGVLVQFIGLWLARHTLKDPLGWLLGIAALYTFIFGATWNPDLGFVDWDLLSLQGIFVSLFVGYRLVRQETLQNIAVTVWGSALTIQSGWLIYNAFFA
jgi:hypothetical protein